VLERLRGQALGGFWGGSWRVLGEHVTRGLGRLLEDVFGGSVGGGFLGVRG